MIWVVNKMGSRVMSRVVETPHGMLAEGEIRVRGIKSENFSLRNLEVAYSALEEGLSLHGVK